MKTMISDLPKELIEEILSRVPLKATRAVVRLTCKKWYTLSKTRMSFAQMHMEKVARGEEKPVTIALMDQNLYLMSIDVDNPSIKIKGKLSCLGEQVKVSRVSLCEGLLLCILEDDPRLVVWYPHSGKTTWIEPRYSHNPDKFRYALGYEEKNSCRSFKLLRYIDNSRNVDPPEKQFIWYEIYDFDSGVWTTLDVTPHWWISACDTGVSIKGNTYWSASEVRGLTDRIISFDFTKERFGPFLSLPFRVRSYEYVRLSGVGEEKLSVLSQALDEDESLYPYELQVWITTMIEVEKVSWSKVFKFQTRDHPMHVKYMGSYYFIDEEKKVAMGFDCYDRYFDRNKLIIIGEAGYITELDLQVTENIHGWPHVCSYVPSLEQIKIPTQDTNKREDSLEKHRFAQKMSRLAAFKPSNWL